MMNRRSIVSLCFAVGLVAATSVVSTAKQKLISASSSVDRLAGGPVAGLVYVALQNENAVYVYDQFGKNHKRIGTLTTGINAPGGLFVYHGDLYVTNTGSNNIAVFHRGDSSPYKTLTASNERPYEVTVDKQGTVYVLAGSKSVYVFARGSTTPTLSFSTQKPPSRLATNDEGTLFIQPSFVGKVEEFTFRSGRPREKLLDVGTANSGAIAFDAHDNLVLLRGADSHYGGGGQVSIYTPPYSGQPIYQRTIAQTIYAASLNRVDGTIWIATECECLHHAGGPRVFELSEELEDRAMITLPDLGDGVAVDSDV